MKRSYVFLAPGFEEIEALATVDIMRRAGLDVKTVAVNGGSKSVTGAHGIEVVADMLIADEDMSDAAWLVIPGGMPGASNLAEDTALCNLLKAQAARKGNIAAICAAPAVVLAPLGILDGKEATCYPGFENQCMEHGAVMVDRQVVNLGNIVTANGPASAMLFALTIVANELGNAASQQVGGGMLLFSPQENLYL